jgi:hypothetical protein
VREALTNAALFPALQGRPRELAGFVWVSDAIEISEPVLSFHAVVPGVDSPGDLRMHGVSSHRGRL